MDGPLVLIDTTGCDMYELVTEDEQSKVNEKLRINLYILGAF